MTLAQYTAFGYPCVNLGMVANRRYLTVKPIDNGWSAMIFLTAETGDFNRHHFGDRPLWHVAVGLNKPGEVNPVIVDIWGPVATKAVSGIMEEMLAGVGDRSQEKVEKGLLVVHCRRPMIDGENAVFAARAKHHRLRST